MYINLQSGTEDKFLVSPSIRMECISVLLAGSGVREHSTMERKFQTEESDSYIMCRGGQKQVCSSLCGK